MADYDVGYGKPPRATRFRKGQSGNPKGRPRKSLSLTESVRKAATKKVAVHTAEGTKRIRKLDALVEKTLNDALKGDQKALAVSFGLLRDVDLAQELEARAQASLTELEDADLNVLARWQAKHGGDED